MEDLRENTSAAARKGKLRHRSIHFLRGELLALLKGRVKRIERGKCAKTPRERGETGNLRDRYWTAPFSRHD